ncbi:MAG: septal ring lytic transglycosylase RlpA family protein [Gammaproteobacteria bacterium]
MTSDLKKNSTIAGYQDPQLGKNNFFPATCFLLLAALMLSACGTTPVVRTQPGGGLANGGGDRDAAPPTSRDVALIPEPIPKLEPRARYGNMSYYEVYGVGYRPLTSSTGYVERGIASWYGTKFHGRRTSSGEPYDLWGISAAHKTLPLPTYVQVSNLQNGRKLIVRVNDRGPFHDNRVIDLSYAAASKLGILATGTGLVEVRAIDPHQPQSLTVIAAGKPQTLTDSAPVFPQPLTPARRAPIKIESLAQASAPTVVIPSPSLYLQMGAFLSRANAEHLRTRLQTTAPSGVEIIEANLNQNTIYRVRLGPLKDVAEADTLTQTISHLGLGTPLVVID